MKQQLSSGAEAIIYLESSNNNHHPCGWEAQHNAGDGGGKIIKHRISKSYRHPELDKQIIKRRTKSETKLLKKAGEFINTPTPEEQEDINKITMPFIDGQKLSEYLDSFEQTKQEKIMFDIGKSIGKIHKEGIIHGDLTTSNMIYKDKKIYIIDFGLGYFNGKYEDKGVDIHLLKQALEAKHFKNWETLFKEFEVGYRAIDPTEAEKVFDRMKAIEKRGRYKH